MLSPARSHDHWLWRYTVTWLPRITVDCDDSTPPLPWASATSQSLTWRAPHSPRRPDDESNERNNSAFVTVRLPFKPGPQRCPGRKSNAPPAGGDDGAVDPYDY